MSGLPDGGAPESTQDSAAQIRALLQHQALGALGTLSSPPAAGDGSRPDEVPEPVVSMVPLLWLPGQADGFTHLSALAPHTRQLRRWPQANLLLMAPRAAGDDPLALPRLSLQLRASPVAVDDAGLPALRSAWAARFASAALTLGLGDFSFWRLSVQSARFVGGFGRAQALGAEAFARIVAGCGAA